VVSLIIIENSETTQSANTVYPLLKAVPIRNAVAQYLARKAF
jgi:hypothetical protein